MQGRGGGHWRQRGSPPSYPCAGATGAPLGPGQRGAPESSRHPQRDHPARNPSGLGPPAQGTSQTDSTLGGRARGSSVYPRQGPRGTGSRNETGGTGSGLPRGVKTTGSLVPWAARGTSGPRRAARPKEQSLLDGVPDGPVLRPAALAARIPAGPTAPRLGSLGSDAPIPQISAAPPAPGGTSSAWRGGTRVTSTAEISIPWRQRGQMDR